VSSKFIVILDFERIIRSINSSSWVEIGQDLKGDERTCFLC